MRMTIDTDRAVGSLLGLAVGDALGTTLEFAKRDSRPPVTEIVGGGPFKLKPGQWTDDTSMALCLADSLIACGELVPDDVMRRFLAWYRNGENSCTGKCFGMGATTLSSLEHFERTGRMIPYGSPMGAGNGSLMRLAPIAIFFASNSILAQEKAAQQSALTHSAEEAALLCRYFAGMLIDAFAGGRKVDVIGRFKTLALVDRRRSEVRSSGYVVDTFSAAAWAVWRTSTFEEAVVLAANLGDDADTVAAVTGQLAGAVYGASAIPGRWLEILAWRDQIEERANSLLRLRAGADQ